MFDSQERLQAEYPFAVSTQAMIAVDVSKKPQILVRCLTFFSIVIHVKAKPLRVYATKVLAVKLEVFVLLAPDKHVDIIAHKLIELCEQIGL